MALSLVISKPRLENAIGQGFSTHLKPDFYHFVITKKQGSGTLLFTSQAQEIRQMTMTVRFYHHCCDTLMCNLSVKFVKPQLPSF